MESYKIFNSAKTFQEPIAAEHFILLIIDNILKDFCMSKRWLQGGLEIDAHAEENGHERFSKINKVRLRGPEIAKPTQSADEPF